MPLGGWVSPEASRKRLSAIVEASETVLDPPGGPPGLPKAFLRLFQGLLKGDRNPTGGSQSFPMALLGLS